MRSIRPFLAAVAVGSAVAAIVAAIVAAPAGATGSPPSPQSVIPGCAWGSNWGEVINPDTLLADPALNAGEPDNSANYWKLDYTYEPGEKITFNGTFADSRFESFQVYVAPGRAFPNSVLTDFEIAPDPGSVNPFQPAGRGQQIGRRSERYTVTLSSDAQPGETNTLPIGPPGQEAGATDLLMIRDYLQTGGYWAVPVPTVTFSYDGVTKVVPACSREQETFPAGTSPDASAASTKKDPPQARVASGVSRPITASRPGRAPKPRRATKASGSPGQIVSPFWLTTVGPSANLDTRYLEALLWPPTNGEVLVVKGKIPTTAHGDTPQPWPSPGVDVRYWSLCDFINTPIEPTIYNQLPDGQVDWGCRNDEQVRLTRDGYYTFAIGTEAQRSTIERIPGVTFLPFAESNPTDTVTALLVRNQLPSSSFGQLFQNAPTNEKLTDQEAAAADEQVIGAYYPKLSWSTIPALEQSIRRQGGQATHGH